MPRASSPHPARGIRLRLGLTVCIGVLTVLGASGLALAASRHAHSPATVRITSRSFGSVGGTPVRLYTLSNGHMKVNITNFGGIIQSIDVPGRGRRMADVALGFSNLAGYEANDASPQPSGGSGTTYFGATIGRYANRIAHGTFTLDGKTYHIPTNEGTNSLHGGTVGFNKRVWTAKEVSTSSGPALELHYLSPDGEMGFPGDLSVTVRFSLNEGNELRLEYMATTDKPTVLNLTNHSYFNLSGQGNGTILHDKIMLPADNFTPVNKDLIPTGEIKSVVGTPFDFRKSMVIGARINEDNEQLKLAKGYDHNWVLNNKGESIALAAKVEDPHSGRVLEVLTNQPGIQFYTGNQLDGSNHGKSGKVYPKNGALCLETQHFPDSPNQSNFPSAVLRPGQKFDRTTIFRFSTE